MVHDTDTYGVIGNPISHSRSPEIFQFFAQQTQQLLIYQKILAPLEGFQQTVEKFVMEGGKGLNITLPFKQQAFHLVDKLTDRAKLARAVNTIIIEDDALPQMGGSLEYNFKGPKLIGDNTDGVGLVTDLRQNHAIALSNINILVIGAGGAARGAVAALIQEKPSSIHIANRTEAKAYDIRDIFSSLGKLTASDLDNIPLHTFDLIINATSSSLHNQLPLLPTEIVGTHSCCYDMFYADEPTLFQKWSKEQGAAFSLNGWGMLVEQAAEGFFGWRRVRPDTKDLLQWNKSIIYK